VAVAGRGALLSMAYYCLRDIRDEQGVPRRVGYLGIMATHEDARRRGHASRLLELTIAAMRRDGCAWSLLGDSELGRPLYERFGWRGFPYQWAQGTVARDRAPAPDDYVIRQYDPRREAAGWAPLAAAYAAFNGARPLSVVRDMAYWQGFAADKYADGLTRNRGVVLVAAPAREPQARCGYVFAYVQEAAFTRQFGLPFGAFTVLEIAVLPEHRPALMTLLWTLADEAAGRGIDKGRVYVPAEPDLDALVAQLFGATLQRGHDWEEMGRPIAPDVDERTIETIFSAPGAYHWLVDKF
jgi:ribosomal protein S18 acetylase RimI-like enzyme